MGQRDRSKGWVKGVGQKGGSKGWVKRVGQKGGSKGWVKGVDQKSAPIVRFARCKLSMLFLCAIYSVHSPLKLFLT